MFKEWAYDFDTGQLKTKNGRPYIVEGKEAIKIWIHKALNTRRFGYGAYSDDYGSEIDDIIGTSVDFEIKTIELKRYIRECLLTNPNIDSVDKVEFDRVGDELKALITITVSGEKGVFEWKQTI